MDMDADERRLARLEAKSFSEGEPHPGKEPLPRWLVRYWKEQDPEKFADIDPDGVIDWPKLFSVIFGHQQRQNDERPRGDQEDGAR